MMIATQYVLCQVGIFSRSISPTYFCSDFIVGRCMLSYVYIENIISYYEYYIHPLENYSLFNNNVFVKRVCVYVRERKGDQDIYAIYFLFCSFGTLYFNLYGY